MSGLPFSPPSGIGRYAETILKNVPKRWNTKAGSLFSAMLRAMGDSDDALGGDNPDLLAASGTSSAVAAGSLTDGAATYTASAFKGFLLRDSGDNWNEISDNTSTQIFLKDGTVTPAAGVYRVYDGGSAIQNVKKSLTVRGAEGVDLNLLARNVGVNRPSVTMSDDLFRALLPLLSWEPKQTRLAVEQVLTVLLGAKGPTTWDLFEVRQNEMIVEVANGALTSGSATYLLADATVSGSATNPKTSYMETDATVAGPPAGRSDFLVADDTLVGAAVTASLVKLILTKYVKAAGVHIVVAIRGES